MRKCLTHGWMAGLLLIAAAAHAQDDFEGFSMRPTQTDAARARHEQHLAAHRGDPDRLVLPGLVADRKAKTVEVLAEATGLGGGEIIEFLLIDQQSSHGYEAVLWSFAKPSDVHRALEFIGLKAGSPIDPAGGRFWSDGDPVAVSVRLEDHDPFPIEQLVLDNEKQEPLPETGFVFAGSVKLIADGEAVERYAADVYEPKSIASIYNEPGVVLDIPRQATKGEVYGRQVVNPEMELEGGTLVTLVMKEGIAAAERRGRQVQLTVATAEGPTGLGFRLQETGGELLAESPELAPILEKLVSLHEEGGRSLVTLSFDEALPLTEVVKTCVLLAMTETILGVARINPAAPGQIYYRAFVPAKLWRDPAGRPTQPWELHLAPNADRIDAQLIRHVPVLAEGEDAPRLEARTYTLSGPADVKDRIETEARERTDDGRAPLPPVLLVYAGPGLTYGQMMTYVSPVLPTHRTVYVFTEDMR